MPELPEVEVTRQGLLPHLPERRITAVWWSNRRLRTPMPRKLLKEYVQGQTITTVDRRAKYLLFRFRNGAVLLLHLGMTGKLGLFDCRSAKARHDHLGLRCENGLELRFNDSRRFGLVRIWTPATARRQEEDFQRRCGLEPFDDAFTASALQRLAATRTLPIKNFLMDSRLVAGIGNIYANEILAASAIDPQAPAHAITLEQWQTVVTECRRILEAAIAAGGSTISDFIGASGQPGYFQLQLMVYKRAGQPCHQCGVSIEKIVLGGRATYFCPNCQGSATGSMSTSAPA